MAKPRRQYLGIFSLADARQLAELNPDRIEMRFSMEHDGLLVYYFGSEPPVRPS